MGVKEVRVRVRARSAGRLERSDSKSIILPFYTTNDLPIVASLLAAHRSVFDLHKGEAVELNVGKVKAGTVDKAWTRRQHSMIWSPQNEKYDFETEVGGKGGGAGGSRGDVDKYLARVIVESDEGDFGEEMEEKEEKEEEEDEKERFRRQLLNRIAE